jgi:hypothetical protein
MERIANIHFATNENKGLLWKILENGSVFNGISDEYVSNIRREFEKKIRELISRDNSRGYSLMELNKMFISEMIGNVETFKESVKKRQVQSKLAQGSSFEEAVEKKKEDFESFIAKPPVKVDFSDKIDEAIGESNIGTILAETIARREKELNFVLEKQIKNDNPIANSSINNTIKIGDVLNVKQVRFSDKVEMRENLNIQDGENSNNVEANEIANKAANEIANEIVNEVDATAIATEVANEIANKVANEMANKVANEMANKVAKKSSFRIMKRMELIEKIDNILKKAQRDVLDIVREL